MIPKVGQHVKCILRTGAMAEGIVEEWETNVVQLRSLDGESILIIPHANEDISLIKIVLSIPQIDLPESKTETVKLPKGELEEKYQQAVALPTEDPTRVKTLAELRIMMAAQEKQIISEKVKDHHITEVPKAKYGYPKFFKKQSPK